jgi:hypothetical protein
MVEERLTDGVRIAQLLASEVQGGVGALATCRVVDADRDVEPTPDGALAYRVRQEDGPGGAGDGDSADGANAPDAPDDTLVADVFVSPDRARVEFVHAADRAVEPAEEEGLRVRPKAVRPPRTLVFLPDGASVKRVLPAFEAVLATE